MTKGPQATRARGRWGNAALALPLMVFLALVVGAVSLVRITNVGDWSERQRAMTADTLWLRHTVENAVRHQIEVLRVFGASTADGPLERQSFIARAVPLMRTYPEIVALHWLPRDGSPVVVTADGAVSGNQSAETREQVAQARRLAQPQFSPGVGVHGSLQADTLELHVPIFETDEATGVLTAVFSAKRLLDAHVPPWFGRSTEVSLSVARSGSAETHAPARRPAAVQSHLEVIALPGATLELSTRRLSVNHPLTHSLLAMAFVLLASMLLWGGHALARYMAKRNELDIALREQVAYRQAMEDSLVTGLRARDLEGRVTHVNAAFCKLVGFSAEELVGLKPPMPYWAPEAMSEYSRRMSEVLAGTVTRDAYETVFMRRDGTRIPVAIYEAPLVNAQGEQTGWVASIVDLSQQRKMEELSRQQQEKLHASSRLVTMGELASTLSHEVNQPLSAITSYAAAGRNLAASGLPKPQDVSELMEQIGQQAQRAGEVIKSVHAFVQKRSPQRVSVTVPELIAGVRPLVQLQARRARVTVEIEMAPDIPPLRIERVMIEQVLLNLTRNAVDAMAAGPAERRVLRIVVTESELAESALPVVEFAVTDRGSGIDQTIVKDLFAPFVTTKPEGMGMGLAFCRTAIEFHGGRIGYESSPSGTTFRFTIPVVLTDEGAALAAVHTSG